MAGHTAAPLHPHPFRVFPRPWAHPPVPHNPNPPGAHGGLWMANNNPLSALRLAFLKMASSLGGAAGRRPPDISAALANPRWPAAWPFADADFARQDESRDTRFYDTPRLVYHIDEYAVRALTNYYARTLPPKADILDCALLLGQRQGGGGGWVLVGGGGE